MVPVLNLSLLALREVDKALWREVKVTTNGQAAPVLHVVGDESAVLAAIGERGNAVDWILSMCIVGNATSQPWPEKAQEIPLLLLGEKNESSLRPLKQKACKSDEEAGTEVACFLAAFGFAERIKPKAVVFDLGGVVVCGDQRILCDRLFPDRPPEQRPYWMADVYKTDMWARLDAGRLTYEEAKKIETRPEFAYWLDHFSRAMTPSQEVKDLMARLQAKKVPMFCFSNFHRKSFAECSFLYPEVFDKFTDVTVSYLTHHLKPETEAYQDCFRMLAKHGLQPSDCVFLDDTPDNVYEARNHGMAGLLVPKEKFEFAGNVLAFFNLI